MPLKVICAWCGKTMKEGSEPASHGICPDCRGKHFPPQPVSGPVNPFPEPPNPSRDAAIGTTTEDGNIIWTNKGEVMSFEACNPADHAASMIESCHGNAREALELAHLNMEFAHGDDQDYWDRVAIAIQWQTPEPPSTRSPEFVQPFKGASALGTDMGLSLRTAPIAIRCMPLHDTTYGQNCSLSTKLPPLPLGHYVLLAAVLAGIIDYEMGFYWLWLTLKWMAFLASTVGLGCWLWRWRQRRRARRRSAGIASR
jgi:hypothetical protein